MIRKGFHSCSIWTRFLIIIFCITFTYRVILSVSSSTGSTQYSLNKSSSFSILYIQYHRLTGILLNPFPSLFPLKFILRLSHPLLKNLASLNQHTSRSHLSSELDNGTHMRDFNAPSQLQDLEIRCGGKN